MSAGIDWVGFADSLAIFEDRTVSLTSVRIGAGGNRQPVTVRAARGKPTWRVLQQTNGGLVSVAATYSVRKLQAPGPWKPGDLLSDYDQEDATEQDKEGITYRVLTAEVDEGFWLLSVFDPKISWELRDTCTILAITEARTNARTRTTSNAAVPAWTNLPCRIQPVSTEFQTLHGKVGDRRMFQVFLDADLSISPTTHLVQWTDPDTAATVTGDIRGVTMRGRIDEPMRLTVELRVGP
jgi:hypothetical protein